MDVSLRMYELLVVCASSLLPQQTLVEVLIMTDAKEEVWEYKKTSNSADVKCVGEGRSKHPETFSQEISVRVLCETKSQHSIS